MNVPTESDMAVSTDATDAVAIPVIRKPHGLEIHSYPKILNLGHAGLYDLLNEPVLVEEKIDGSQFSFGIDAEGVLYFRSKGASLYPETADKLFKHAVQYVEEELEKKLTPGWVYRGEVLCRRRHNTLTYDRAPKHGLALFDISPSEEAYLSYEEKVKIAETFDLEVVPKMYEGMVTSLEQLRGFLDTTSFLGGPKVEGIVIKNYARFGKDGKAMMGKWVREEFKEMHGAEWSKNNPTRNDVIESIIAMYRNENRWSKAVQHLKEKGQLQNAPQDIGALMKEVNVDVLAECEQEIKEALWKYAWPKIGRGITRGLPEFYKNLLAEKQFETKSTEEVQHGSSETSN